MFNRRRITAALIGLLVLVLGGWLVKDNLGGGSPSAAPSTSASSSTAPAKGGAAVPGADSGLPV
ncbi:ribonuclease N, partial [Amycolatopsis mediterranei]